jgi:hypothetical protein
MRCTQEMLRRSHWSQFKMYLPYIRSNLLRITYLDYAWTSEVAPFGGQWRSVGFQKFARAKGYE